MNPMTTPQISLKPCPLPMCSGAAVLTRIGNEHTIARSVNIRCSKCGLERTVKAIRNSLDWCEEQAIAAWNTRQPDRPDVRQALEELCDAVNCATSSGYTNYSRYVKDAHRAALAALAQPEAKGGGEPITCPDIPITVAGMDVAAKQLEWKGFPLGAKRVRDGIKIIERYAPPTTPESDPEGQQKDGWQCPNCGDQWWIKDAAPAGKGAE